LLKAKKPQKVEIIPANKEQELISDMNKKASEIYLHSGIEKLIV
jgi:hypothetical protein